MKTSSNEDKMWGDVLVMDLMTSEESAVDDEVLIIHPLPWRSNHHNKFIDETRL